MEKYIIEGGIPLAGAYKVKGAKNAALPILAATVAVPAVHIIRNCPDIKDINCMYRILEDIGARPIDIHINGLLSMGYDMAVNEERIRFSGKVKDEVTINLPFPSVGATENLMLAALNTSNQVVLNNCAKEPEIEDLQNFLNSCGANVVGAGTRTIVIRKSHELHGTDYSVMGDRIEASTYLIAASATGGNLTVSGIENRFMYIDELNKMGADIIINDNKAIIKGVKKLKGNKVVSRDLRGGAALVIAGLMGDGTTEIEGIEHIQRGYESLDKNIKLIGGIIEKKEEPEIQS